MVSIASQMEQTLQNLLQPTSIFSAAQTGAAYIDCDPEQPGLERRIFAERFEVTQGGKEGLLCAVFRFVCIVENGESQAVHILLIGLHHFFDGERISLPALFEPMAVHDGHSNGLDAAHGETLHLQLLFRLYFPALMTSQIRNFCIIAHVDHGKSTLADRMLHLTGTVPERNTTEQILDTMDLEREKGVTIKASAVRMNYTAKDGSAYELNLIDTPGHVDFGYEVSRALKACEGAVLVVDATQGIEAQTLANLYQALDADLTIIPVINKIDLPSAHPDEVSEDIASLLGVNARDIIRISAKEGVNVDQVLESIVQRVPSPKNDSTLPLRALIFDSHYDAYKGVIAYIRVFEGSVKPTDTLHMFATKADLKPVEIGIFAPDMKPEQRLMAGEVGYIATGLKTVHDCRVGDTITLTSSPASEPLPGYRYPKPMVFAGIYPVEAEEYTVLRESLDKLQLNDASLTFEPETSQALGFGFRAGFLGLFHMEIVQERIEREYLLDVLFTAPSVEYEVVMIDGTIKMVDSPADLPDESKIVEIREPWMNIEIITPTEYYGPIMEIVTKRRGIYKSQEYPAPHRVQLNFEIPLSEIIVDFFDELKSRTKGYASLDYQFLEYRPDELQKLEILVNGEPVDALAAIVHEKEAFHKGQRLITKLKAIIPRQLFDVAIQAAAGGRVISRANVKATRKDVLAKCYGGDISRKKKLLEKQKRGKKRLKMVGNVEIPQEAFMAVLKLEEES
jgi:GTP-binding protein LepA